MKNTLCLILCLTLLGSGCVSKEGPITQPTTGSNEVNCNNILTPELIIVMLNGSASWVYGPQMQPGFKFSSEFMNNPPVCHYGNAMGQNVNHLYCQPYEHGTHIVYASAERTNVSSNGTISSHECYIINVNELAPGDETPPEFQAELKMYPNAIAYQAWDIVNVTCEPC